MTDEYRRDAAVTYLLAAMLEGTGVEDVERGRFEVREPDFAVYAKSESRGWVRIGTYPDDETITHEAMRLTREQVDYNKAQRLPWAELYTELVVAERTRKATEATMTKGDRHRSRARELKKAGLTAAQIGARMAAEDGRDVPYDPRQVREWLADTRKRTA